MIALAGDHQIAYAVLAISDGQSLDVGEEVAVADPGDLCVIRSGLRLGAEFPDPDGLLGDVEMAQFVIGYAAFDHRAEFDVADLLRVDLSSALEEFPLLDFARFACSEIVNFAGLGAPIHAHAVNAEAVFDLARRDVFERPRLRIDFVDGD